jgi:hypothetical protein
MSFKPLTLLDRPIFKSMETSHPLYTSDTNFTNIFIWQSYYNFSWAQNSDCLCLLAQPENSATFGFPPIGTGNKLKAVEFLVSQMEEPRLSRVPEELAQLISQNFPNWQILPDPDNDDYVYLAEKLINLSGRRMHQKKNHYNYFIQNYPHEFQNINQALLPELIEMESQWLISKTEKIGANSHLIKEKESVHSLLENMTPLEVTGLVVRIKGKIEAFTIGESLNKDTAIIHVEKGNPDIRGIYIALCSQYCRAFFPDKTFINREQDLGLPGLKQSKESLKPDHMRKKFIIIPN